jgi:hypothetical protein
MFEAVRKQRELVEQANAKTKGGTAPRSASSRRRAGREGHYNVARGLGGLLATCQAIEG